MITTDRIEKQVTLRAPMARVWRALTDTEEFGRWFGVRLDGPFAPGRAVTGVFTEALNEAAILDYQRQRGLPPSKVKMPEAGTVFCTVERMEPMHTFSFRWVPYAVDAEADLRTEPTTLVEFRLQEGAEGTMLTIVESGFDRVPAHRRERAFRMNEGGWGAQARNLKAHVEGT